MCDRDKNCHRAEPAERDERCGSVYAWCGLNSYVSSQFVSHRLHSLRGEFPANHSITNARSFFTSKVLFGMFLVVFAQFVLLEEKRHIKDLFCVNRFLRLFAIMIVINVG